MTWHYEYELVVIFFFFLPHRWPVDKEKCSCCLQLFLIHESSMLQKNSVTVMIITSTKKQLSSWRCLPRKIELPRFHRKRLHACLHNTMQFASRSKCIQQAFLCLYVLSQQTELQTEFSSSSKKTTRLSAHQIIKNSLHFTFGHSLGWTVQTIEHSTDSHAIHKFIYAFSPEQTRTQ